MSDLRERRLQERAHRVALRIHAERQAGKAAHYPSLDSLCPPVPGGAWRVPEPSPQALEHMAAFGFVEAEGEAAAAPVAPAVREAAITQAIAAGDERTLAQQIAAGVRAALAAMGLAPPPATGAPPMNEDK